MPSPSQDANLKFDLAYTSVLKRAISTLWLSLEALDQTWIPVKKSWRLNERHYGALQGLNKKETVAKHGIDQVRPSPHVERIGHAGLFSTWPLT